MTLSLEEAVLAEKAARKKVSALESARDTELREAAAAIRNKHSAAIHAAQLERQQAHAELVAAKDRELTAHEWDGRRVFRIETYFPQRCSSQTAKRRIDGIVETVRANSQFPDNYSGWRRPELGAHIVRPIKKDGTAGLAFEPFDPRHEWQLAEDVNA